MIERLEKQASVMIAGHRGFKFAYPENTLLAFEKAMDAGVDMLEFDLRLSKDNVIMVIHDETVDRTTNGSGKVSDYTSSELKLLDTEIPTFSELCELLKSYPDMLLNVEIKSSPNAKEVTDEAITMLKEYGYLSNCVFTSFDAAIVTYIHDHYKLKAQGFPAELMHNFVSGRNGTYSKMWAVGISMKLLTPTIVKQFQDMGILVWSYCPDDDQMVYYALGCGVTGMTCNNPLPAFKIVHQHEPDGK